MVRQQRQSLALEEVATTVFASDDVPSDFVAAQLTMADSIAAVTQLEVEGSVLSEPHHYTIMPLLQSMLFSGKKDWKSVQFVDSVSHEDFSEWQTTKEAMMRQTEMNEAFSPVDWCNGKLSWKATMTIPANISLHCIMTAINEDAHIFDVTMRHTRTSIILELSCGWASRTTQAKDLLRSHLSTSTRQAGQKQMLSDRSESSFNTSISSFSSSSMPSNSSRGSRRQRKRVKKMSQVQEKESPDYNWKVGAYTLVNKQ